MDALAPFRCPGPEQDPTPLPYLNQPNERRSIDINLTIGIQPPGAAEPTVLSNTNLRYMYWSLEQMLVHHSVTGCNMQPGDLCGTGTISGPEQFGSMLEITWRGANPVKVGEEERKFINDGDNVHLRGHCQGEGFRVGFGECTGVVLPAHPIEDI